MSEDTGWHGSEGAQEPHGGPPRVSRAPEVRYDDGTLAPQPLNEEIKGKAIYVPEMTEEETYKNFATWGKPLVKIEPPKGVSVYTFRDVLAGAYQVYLNGDEIKPETVAKMTGLKAGNIAKVLASQELRLALKARGVAEPANAGMTSEMDFVLQIIMDPHDGLTFQKKLWKAGISNTKYQSFMRNPVFRSQIERMSESLINNTHEALLTIAAETGRGNLKAAQLQLEINGRYNPAKEQKFDAFVMMQQMFEVMAKHIKDPATLKAIAADMRDLADDTIVVTQKPGLQQTITQNMNAGG